MISGASLERRWCAGSPDLAILDSALPNCNLSRIIPKLKASSPFVPVIVLTKGDGPGWAMEALRLGAEQVLLKPLDLPVLSAVIERTLEHQRLRRRRSAETLHSRTPDPFSGGSEAIRSLAELAKKAALSDSPVVIEGERGTGRRLLASWLHEHGQRASHPLIELNCGSLLCNGAERDRIGLWDRQGQPLAGLLNLAHGGTIVLAEIQNADLKTQAKLLQILGKNASRSGNRRSTRCIRLIATTRESLPELVNAKRFRAELSSRLSGFTLQTPPLRDRLGDLPILTAQILGNLACELGSRDFDLTREALHVLQSYSWPGNIRELRVVLERAVLLATSTLLTAADLQLGPEAGKKGEAPSQFRNLREMEQQYVEHVLQRVGGRVQTAAKILNVPRSSLYNKLKQYQFEREGMRSAS